MLISLQDPTAVSALLDQLRTSQAWRDVLAANPPQSRPESSTVANLLEQLNPTASSGPALDRSPSPPAQATPQEHRDLHSYTFQQALPVIAKLASDSTFLLEIQKVQGGPVCYSKLINYLS